ncbi:GDP dissociation inhibitor [Trichuris suis]|nr:GDP dissociation inhibitor [Trichuris suis]
MELKDFALPDAVDVVVLGTGLPECVLAAASARIGLSVLHLDKNEYYGGFWASFTFEQLQKWIKDRQDVHIQDREVSFPSFSVANGEVECRIGEDYRNLVHHLAAEWHIPNSVDYETCGGSAEPVADFIETGKSLNISRQYFKEKSRLFNIDLAPKACFGKSTDILIRSGVSQYIEFKSVDRVLTAYNEKLEKVPLSRNQVFQSKEIDLMDKRLLMRLLSLCWDYESRSDEWEIPSLQP